MRTPAKPTLIPSAMRIGALVAVVTLLLGCAPRTREASVVEITRWTVRSSLGEAAVTVPAHLDRLLPPGPTTYTLTARVPLPPELRDRPLTLAIAQLPALATLRAGGRDAVDLETSTLRHYASTGAHAWRIDDEETHGDSIELEITVDRAWLEGAWVNTVPALSASPRGDPHYLFVSRFNEVTAEAALTTSLLMSFTYGVLYLFDRRRKAHAWLALQGLSGAAYPALVLGITQPIFGLADIPIGSVGICVAAVCSLHFVVEVAGLRRPRALWWGWVVAAALVAAFGRDPFRAPNLSALLCAMTIIAVAIRAFFIMFQKKLDARIRVAVIGFPVMMILLFALPDAAAVLGVYEPWSGVRGGSLGFGLIAVLEALLLSRDHDDSMRHADELNIELAERIGALARTNEEIRVLNDELRRQIVARSERLADALGRMGPVGLSARAFAAGEVIDERYRIVRAIGEGGMGVVYETERIPDGKRLALKVLHAPRNGAELARLAREAEIASRVDHPNIVRIVDVDVAKSGALFIVMEYVDGASLDGLRARYADRAWGIPILRQVAAGLAALHAEGIVHRDLKPGNVLVATAPSGDVAKIADFGIATRDAGLTTTAPRALTPELTRAPRDAVSSAEGEEGGERSTSPALTRTGQILGTPIYMAPELMAGAKLANAASDVYAFGVIAREVLTGSLPEGFEMLLHLRSREGAEVPSIASSIPSLPGSIAVLLDACLAHDPTLRPSAEVLALSLHD